MNTEAKEELKALETSTPPDHEQPKDYSRLLQNMKNNNHHIVPCGILVVIFTLYLTATSLQRNYDSYFGLSNASVLKSVERQRYRVSEHDAEIKRQSVMLSKLREHEKICYDLAIFTKESNHQFNERPIENTNDIKNDVESVKDNQKQQKKSEKHVANGNGSNISSGHKQSNNNKSNKSKLSKQADAKKKDSPKKNSTAEPIIYLFALVFIYLLLKAASDINQHYKLQNKGDKRLRRCSLQSYAQAHKQDRRASKDTPLHRNSKYLSGRSISVDRFKRVILKNDDELSVKSELLANMRKYTSLDEPMKPVVPTPPPSSPFKRSIDFQNIAEQRLDLHLPNFNRRGSVPVTINYQPIPITTNPNRPLIRRTSMIGGSLIGQQIVDPTLVPVIDAGVFPEQKRRVRMINRH